MPYESVALTMLISAPSDLTRENFQIVADTISRWTFRSCREMSKPVATSPAMLAYVTTETGAVTMIIMVMLASYLLIRRAADFAKAEPKTPQPTTRSHIAARPTNTDEPR